ncbi:MAG: DUF697 domain-containing protein [Anaeroplasma sp.]
MRIKKKKEDKAKYLWYTIAVGCLIIFALILLSSLLDIGEKLRNISVWLEVAFYVLVALVIILVIIRPIVLIVKSPSLSIITSTDDRSSKAIAIYKKVAKTIVNNNDLPNEQLVLLTSYKSPDELLFNISFVFENTIKKQLNGIIIKNAKTVMISTAICQSARFDMMTVFAINLKMIKELVLKCGFRPSMKNLSKLTINVFTTALIAEGLENLTLEDVMPKSTMNMISEVPMLGKVLDSVIDGAANALLTIRIGCVTRRYLYSDGSVVTKEDIRKGAYKETIKIIPLVMAETISFFPKKIVKFFTKSKEVDSNAE